MPVQPTIVSYAGDGSTKNFTFQFDYLDPAYVKARVDGNDVTFTFNSEKVIQLDTAPTVGQTLVISRETERERLVDFVDGSVLIEDDLDLSANQLLHIVQEAIDLAGTTLGLAADGSLQASGRRIGSVGDPTNPQDVVTKNWAESAMSSQLVAATTARTAAEAAQSAAETAQSGAQTARTGAETAETNAAASEAAADADRIAAQAAAAAAATSEANAATSEASAATSEANAATSEANAAASAAAAAAFVPADYVSKAGDETITGDKNFSGARLTGDIQVLAPATAVTPDFSTSNRFDIMLNQNITMNSPSNLVPGQSIMFVIQQDATGGRLVAWNASFKWPGGSAPSLTAAANGVDIVVGEVISSTFIACNIINDVK